MPRDRVWQQLAGASLHGHPAQAARSLERMPVKDVAGFLQRQDPGAAASVLQRSSADRAATVIEVLDEPHASAIIRALEPALVAALVARLDDAPRRARLATLAPDLARELQDLATYPPGVAGAMMDPRVTTLRAETTVREALARLRALRNRAIHDVYVVDEQGRLAGGLSVQELALAAPGAALAELAHPDPPRVQALAPQEEFVALAADRRLTSLPVVDVAERLVGVLRYNDLRTAAEHDATADLQTMVGVSREERALSGVSFAVRKRLPWLQVNLGTAFLAAAVVGVFEGTIARFTALAVLLPVVAGQSGNTGAQALAVTMRGLALREIRLRHWFRVGRKELAVGAFNGVMVALVTALGVYVWSQSVGLATVIAVAMVCSMVIAGVAGASVPMLLILLRQDPAAASSIVLTTITDVVGFLTFLGFATLASGLL